jgi:hypothetical protein
MRRSHILPPALTLTALVAASPPASRRITLARPALGVYVAALAATAVACSRRARLADAGTVPLVLAVMHLAWGAGFLVGAARFGPPVAAILRLPLQR